MKIRLNRRTMALAVLLIIFVPIIYNKISTGVLGYMMTQAMKMPKEVVVDKPFKEKVFVSAESTGRVEAKYSVDIVARVPGFLLKKHFKEGDVVKKGQLLFQIDPKEYELEVNNSRATVNQYDALYQNAQQELNRANELIKEDLVSHSYVDESLATRNANKALYDAAKQRYELAKVNLGYTTIKSPIDGRIGKVNITEGNYVQVTSGPLVNISSTDPVYVTFSLRSADFVKLLRASDKFKDVEVKVQFSDGNWYEHTGVVNFVDNQIDKNSGSVQMRATFENPKGVLVPGDYMKVKLVAPQEVSYMTVPQACTKGDAMSGYYVWVVEADKNAKPRKSLFGKVKEEKPILRAVRKDIKVSDDINNNWIVEEGLTYSDDVVVAGVQSVVLEGQQVKILDAETYAKKKKGKK